MERGGGAWCPRPMIHNEGTEFLEINLGALHVLTKVEVQGRFGNGQGKEFAEKFKLQYWREGLAHWITYRDGRGNQVSGAERRSFLCRGKDWILMGGGWRLAQPLTERSSPARPERATVDPSGTPNPCWEGAGPLSLAVRRRLCG